MRVCIVISKFLPEYTGAAYRTFNSYDRLNGRIPELSLRVCCNSTEFPSNKRYHYEGVPVDRVAFKLVKWLPERVRRAVKFYIEAIGTFGRLWVNEKPDVIHIIGASGGTAAALIYSRLFSVPRILELVTKEASPEQFLPGLRYKRFLRLNCKTVLIAISPEIAARCNALGYKDNVWCRPNSVDVTRFFLDRSRKSFERSNLTPFQSGDVVIGMVAKFMPQKNQIFLLDVLKELPEKYKLLLAGPVVSEGIFLERDRKYFCQIVDRIKEMNLSSRVHLIAGFVDSARVMTACDIYAMPQVREGLGTPMLEAIASGIPVVANAEEHVFNYWIEKTSGGIACPLTVDNWLRGISAVESFGCDDLKGAADKVLSYAGHTVLDDSFVTLLKGLSCKDADILGVVNSLGLNNEC